MGQVTKHMIKKITEIYGIDKKDIDLDDFMILSDDQADQAVRERIEQDLWAFNPSFLSSVTGLSESTFKAIESNNKREDNNEAILELVEATCGLDDLVEEAIRWDSRGHFLSSHDGQEHELGDDMYLYRIN